MALRSPAWRACASVTYVSVLHRLRHPRHRQRSNGSCSPQAGGQRCPYQYHPGCLGIASGHLSSHTRLLR